KLKQEAATPLKLAKSIYCIGIGGSGLSGLARMLSQQGKKVAGSDSTSSSTTDELLQEAIEVFIGHNAANVPSDTEIVIYSPAVPENNPERLEAAKRNLQQFSYP